MKKIYILTAIFALLTLSLNAQTTYEKVTSSDQLVVGNTYILVSEDANFALTATASSTRLAGEAVTISNNTVTLATGSNVAEFTLGGSSNSYTLANGGNYLSSANSSTNLTLASSVGDYSTWRLNNNNGALTGYRAVNSTQTNRAVIYRTSSNVFGNYATSNIGSNNDYSYAFLYVKVSTDPVITATPTTLTFKCQPGESVNQTVAVTGKNLTENITASISRSGEFSVDPTSLGTTGGNLTVTYSPNATGTHTATLTLSSADAEPVTITLDGTCANIVTVCDGVNTDDHLPVYGYYFEKDQINQMVYPASELASLVGKEITSMTFYPTNGINFYKTSTTNGTVTFSLGMLTPSNTDVYDDSPVRKTGYSEVATITLPESAQSTLTEWVINFDTPFEYTGGDLLLDVQTDHGYWGGTTFSGQTTNYYQSYWYRADGTATRVKFLPKVTFAYEDNNVPALTAPTNGEEINVGESLGGASVTKTITVSGRNLTEDLTISVTGTGFTVEPTTLSAADVNNGTATVTVTYSGTANGTGSMTISSNEVSVTVDLTATYVDTTPVLTAPENNSTVNVGTNTGSGVSKTINVKGQYLTQDLTVSVSGAGFSVSRDVTVTAAEANAGKDITVTYNGTNANATGTLTISSGEVSATVNLTASYSDNGEITVAEGTTTNMFLPVYGGYYEQVQLNQMIYPSSMLSDMEGKYITSITFYPAPGTLANGTAISGIMFSGGKVMLSLGSTSNNSFTSNAAISATVTPVAEINDVQQDENLTAWTFTFDTPYLYEGGNLLVQVDTEAGDYYRTFFYGTTMSRMGRHQYSSTGALDNFLPKATFTYTSNAPVVPAVEGGLLRLHLLFCDQLKASIPEDNSHPDAYGYILKFEPEGGETKKSGSVRVNIQKTDCEVMGYYTLDQIDRDTDRGLTMDVLTADVEYNLTSTNDLLNYYYLQGAKSAYPRLDDDYLSKLYRQEDFTYREMLEGTPEFDHVFNSGEHHYFNSAAEPVIGSYGDDKTFMSYAPSVTTWGIQRRYFELDMKDNTYGGPVWKTAVGKAQMGLDPIDPDAAEYKPVVEFQQGWNTSWKDANGVGSNLYMLDNINALGYLPPKNLTKVEFEPYMFRVFVESDHGKLRPFKYVKDNNGNDVITAGEGSTNGPICVWSGYIKRNSEGEIINDPENGVTVDRIGSDGPFTYTKNKVNRANPDDTWTLDENNAIFGALDDLLEITGYDAQGKPIYKDIPEEDLRIFVRFYFSVKGEAADHTPWTRAEGSRSGNGAESGGSAAGGVATSVKELQYHGDAVETIYYNIQGMSSDRPFEGVNIVVTRYSDGATVVSKVVK